MGPSADWLRAQGPGRGALSRSGEWFVGGSVPRAAVGRSFASGGSRASGSREYGAGRCAYAPALVGSQSQSVLREYQGEAWAGRQVTSPLVPVTGVVTANTNCLFV